LRPILTQRLKDITVASDGAFQLSDAGAIIFAGAAVGRLAKGADWLSPRVELMGGQEADDAAKAAARERMQTWLEHEITEKLPSHRALKSGDTARTLEGLARGIAFRLLETGAAIDLRMDDPGHRIEAAQREGLRAAGVRTGRVAAYIPDAQKPVAQRLISSLRTVFDADACPAAPEGAGSFATDMSWSDQALAANGYLRFGRRAVRADLAERLAWEVSKRRKDAGKNLFALPAELASIVSCPGDDFPGVLKGIGLVPAEKDPETGVPTLWRYAARSRQQGDGGPQRRDRRDARTGSMGPGGRGKPHKGDTRRQSDRSAPRRRPEQRKQADPNSPFAALAVLLPEEKPKPKKKRKPKKKSAAAPRDGAAFVYRPFQ
ncbi:MAG: helicase, partial [Pseudomonadota bacterium]